MTTDTREYFPRIAELDEIAASVNSTFSWVGGIPDSCFKALIPRLDNWALTTRENHALAMAFGVRLGGGKPALMIQNSGLGLMADAFFGLQELYGLGLVAIVSNRGELDWEEPQHQEWGDKTQDFLDVLGFQTLDFGTDGVSVFKKAADIAFTQEKSVAVLVHRGNIDETI